MKKYQIGVMGSAADLQYSAAAAQVAKQVGKLIAEAGGILIFGAEKDVSSLSTMACVGASEAGGITVGITYEKGQNIWGNMAPTIIIPTGLVRGGGRELTLVLSCDAIISISGGSGTLNEITVAYQAGIPVIALTGFGGWSDKLAGEYLDARNRQKIIAANSVEDAVQKAFLAAGEFKN